MRDSDPPTPKNEQLRQIQINCCYHHGEICLNYCMEKACMKMLCSECIEEHLLDHKKANKSDLSIKSVKRVRMICVDKLNKLIAELLDRMAVMKKPQTAEEMMEDTERKLAELKHVMYQIIEEEFQHFNDQIRIQIKQSTQCINNLNSVHEKLAKLIEQLQDSKKIIVEGDHEIVGSIEKVLSIDDGQFVGVFNKEIHGYMQEFEQVNFDLEFSEGLFRKAVHDCLKISQEREQMSYQPPTPIRSRHLTQTPPLPAQPPKPTFQSQSRLLHFFEAGSQHLHLCDLSSMPPNHKLHCVPLHEYSVPDFHASVMCNGYIFISGGIIEMEDGDVKLKVEKMGRYSIMSKVWKADFSRVLGRSSHCLCQCGQYVYVLGGYGLNEDGDSPVECAVERVSIKKGEVVLEESSRWGGACFALCLNHRIVKASAEGVEVYNPQRKQWTVLTTPANYQFYLSAGYAKLSEEYILVYGGYDNDAKGVDHCWLWMVGQTQVQVKQYSMKLPVAEGFSTNPALVLGNWIYALQNIVEEGQESYVLEEVKRLVGFDGRSWRKFN